jgi:polysaccharide biosynthesis protein PslG
MQWRPPTAVEVVAVLALCATAGLASALLQPNFRADAASSAYAGRVGLNAHLVWVSEAEAKPQLQQARAGGVEWVREEFPWRLVEPSQGSFRWTNTDGLMAAAAASGMNVLGLLDYSAPWAASGPELTYPPRDAQDYARYAAAVVKRYGPGGSFWASRPDLPARPLTAVELWNEPNGYWAWKPNPDPAAYARLARAAATAIRQANPQVKILICGDLLQVRTDGAIVGWLENLLNADPTLPQLVDAYSIHPYPYPFSLGPYAERADQKYWWDYRRVEVAHRIALERNANRPFWITEIGWSTATAATGSVSEETQAAYVREAVRQAMEDWGGFVERIFMYQWDRSNGIMTDREGNFGLRRADGSPKPAWHAVASLIRGGSATRAPANRRLEDARRASPRERRDLERRSALGVELSRYKLSQRGVRLGKLPRWFWSWARWRTGDPNVKVAPLRSRRPEAAPYRIPRWAWRRLRFGKPSMIVTARGRVHAHTTSARRRIEHASKIGLKSVSLYRKTGSGWKRSARCSVMRDGRFVVRARLPDDRSRLVIRALVRIGGMNYRSSAVSIRSP